MTDTISDDDIINAISGCDGNKVDAAQKLGITIRSLRYKIKKSPSLTQRYSATPVSYIDIPEPTLPGDVRGEFNDYMIGVIEKKPGYRFANDKKRDKIRKQVLREFLAGKVRT